MGTALATRLVEKGWYVALFDISHGSGEALASRLGPKSAFFLVDVASYDSQAAGFAAVFSKWGRIDALLANAGIVDRSSIYILRHRGRPVDDVPPAPDLSTTDVDYKGVVYGTQLCIHFMRHNPGRPGGKIVATASVAGVIPHSSYPEYNGAKAGVINFARGVAPVLRGKEGIAISVVCPGIVSTSIIPPEMVAAVSPECMTPVETIVKAYQGFLDEEGEGRAGEIVECSADRIITLKTPELGNGRVSQRAVTVWDPLFKALHAEGSGLSSAIP